MGDNWVLKSSNIRKLIRNLEHYYHDDLHKDADFQSIQQNKIAKEADPAQVASLIELVAAAAVTCPEKAQHVGRIMQMTADSQVAMKFILQQSLSRLTDYDDDDDESPEENELVFGGSGADLMADDSTDHDDDPQRSLFGANHNNNNDHEIQEQLQQAQNQIAALKSQATISQEDHERAQTKLRALVEDLQDRLVKRQDDLIQVEEDLQTAQSQLDDCKSKLSTVTAEKNQLLDDLDVANARAQQLYKAEATVVAYKKKLDSVGVMNQQMTELEDQASSYLRQIMELENEVKRSTALQKRVQELQDEVAALTAEKDQTASSQRTSATAVADLQRQLVAAESAKKMFQEELRELRAQQDSSVVDVESTAATVHDDTITTATSMSKEQREKTMRLEIENKQLQEQVEQLRATPTVTAAAAATTVAASADNDSAAGEIARLTAALEAKTKENSKISSDKDKLEAYTKRTLAKFQDKYLVALQECKAKLKEKQDKIEILEQRSVSERTAQKREERLLSSTIYELGLAIMQNRLKSGGAAVSG